MHFAFKSPLYEHVWHVYQLLLSSNFSNSLERTYWVHFLVELQLDVRVPGGRVGGGLRGGVCGLERQGEPQLHAAGPVHPPGHLNRHII